MTRPAQISFGIFPRTPSFGQLILPRRDLNTSLSRSGWARGDSNPGSPASPQRLPEPCGKQLPASHDEILIFPALGTEFIKPHVAPPTMGGTAPAASLILGVTQRCHHSGPGVSQEKDTATQVRQKAKITPPCASRRGELPPLS